MTKCSTFAVRVSRAAVLIAAMCGPWSASLGLAQPPADPSLSPPPGSAPSSMPAQPAPSPLLTPTPTAGAASGAGYVPTDTHEYELSNVRPQREQASIFGGYEIGLPTGDLDDFIGEPSYKGFEFGSLYPVAGGLHLGVFFNYHLFEEDLGRTTTPTRNGAVTATLYRFARSWTLGGAARYYVGRPEAFVRPFAGVRIGVNFVTAATLVSDLSFYETPIGFALAPEAGLTLRVTPVARIALSARYDWSTASYASTDSFSYVAFHFGLVLSGWQ